MERESEREKERLIYQKIQGIFYYVMHVYTPGAVRIATNANASAQLTTYNPCHSLWSQAKALAPGTSVWQRSPCRERGINQTLK